ncbi:MAG: PilN domain-containing protein [Firmicutes bacterium]|nr:PilN domain-containing protein [Bacillota bacterium]
MKREIDLRTREFVASRELYWPRLAVIAVVLLVAVAGSVLLYLDLGRLQKELAYLSDRVEELRPMAVPVITMEEAIDRIGRRATLEKEFRGRITPWSSYLKEFKGAAGEAVTITRVVASNGGKASISGRSEALHDVALYLESLKKQAYFKEVTLASINLEQQEGRLYFTLSATLITGGGSERWTIGNNP